MIFGIVHVLRWLCPIFSAKHLPDNKNADILSEY